MYVRRFSTALPSFKIDDVWRSYDIGQESRNWGTQCAVMNQNTNREIERSLLPDWTARRDITDSDTTGSDSDTTGSDSDTTGSDTDTTGSDSDPTGSDSDATGSDSDTTGSDNYTIDSDSGVRSEFFKTQFLCQAICTQRNPKGPK